MPSVEYQHCPELYDSFEEVRYFKRSVVTGRHWNESIKRIEIGSMNYQLLQHNYSLWSTTPIQKLHYAVRSDMLEAMDIVLQEHPEFIVPERRGAESVVASTADLSYMLYRPVDVAHFWPCHGRGVDRGGKMKNSHLRDNVSCRIINEWNARTPNATGWAGLAGLANLKGRHTAQCDYAKGLLQAKIVVEAQKDLWEGHYRLMEALVSGALVFADRMLSVPEGLEDGVNLVMYSSVDDLIQKVEHYLWHVDEDTRTKMAREGRHVALMRHRSWHVMESIIFGHTLTQD